MTITTGTTGSAVWTGVGVTATVGAAVVGGVFSTFSTFVGRALRSAPTGHAVSVMQAVNVAAVRPPLMIALFGTAVLGIAASVHALRIGGGASWPTVTGTGLYLGGAIGTTIAWNVPRNDRLASWDPVSTSSQQWLSWLSGWEAGNHVRTVASLAAAVLLALGTLRGWTAPGRDT